MRRAVSGRAPWRRPRGAVRARAASPPVAAPAAGARLRKGPALLVALTGLVLSASGSGAEEKAAPDAEAVVLVHGLGRTDRSMRPLERSLEEAGYRVANLRYPSTEHEPEVLVDGLAQHIEACCADTPRLHFVTHSLGGILLRAHLAERKPPNLGRVVMLAPPNRGSEVVDALGDSKLFEWVYGPTARQLGTAKGSLPNRLPPPDYELGVIAGRESVSPAGALFIEGESDGTVSVEHTKLRGMADFLVVPHSHPFIMRSDEVAEQVLEFLRRGRFRHEERAED